MHARPSGCGSSAGDGERSTQEAAASGVVGHGDRHAEIKGQTATKTACKFEPGHGKAANNAISQRLIRCSSALTQL